MSSWLRKVILPLYSVLMRSNLKYWIQLWSPQHNDMDLLELVQRRLIGVTRRQEHSQSRQAGIAGIVEPGEEKAPGTHSNSLLVSKVGL